jgi:hypothetical protein
VYYPSSSDTWEIVGNSTSTLIPSNVDRVQPGASIWMANAGDYYVGWVSMCEEEPIGTILGRVVNEGTGGYLKSSAVCSTGTVVSGLNIGIVETGSSVPGVPVDINQCNPEPYYAKSVLAGSYDVTANIPAGWEALSWGCTSVIYVGGLPVQGGSSCPPNWWAPGGTDWANGTGGTVSNVPVKKNEQAHIWFYIQPIPPKCTISGSTTIVAGETGTFTVSRLATDPVPISNLQMKRVKSTCLATGTCISDLSATLMAFSNCATIGCDSSLINIPWTPTEADITPTDESQPWYFYCQGYNGAINLTSRQCRPFNPYAYPWDLDCVSGLLVTHKNVCDPNSGSDCLRVNVTEPPPWYQAWGGDVHAAKGDVTSYIPRAMFDEDVAHGTKYAFFNLNAETLMTGFPGLISYENTYDFAGPGDIGTYQSSTKKWLAKSNFSFEPSSNNTSVYDYYFKKLGNPVATSFDCDSQTFTGSSYTLAHRAGNCEITDVWRARDTSKTIILVDGDLNITLGNNKEISVDNGAFLAFIVSGNINIDYSSGSKQKGYGEPSLIEGVYMTDRVFNSGANREGSKTRRFIGEGMFYAKEGFFLNRSLKDNPGGGPNARNGNTPSELFIFRPDLVVNAPYELWSSKIDWQEVAP